MIDQDFITLEVSRMIREAYQRADQRVRSQQLGSAFRGLPSGPAEEGVISPPLDPKGPPSTP
jgi:hypothetical protein